VNDVNYQGTSNATLTIKPAPLTVAANNMSKTLGAAIPSLTANYSGFVIGENASALSGSLNCTTTATASSAVGSYPIGCSGLSSANYAISYAPGTLRVLYAPAGLVCFGAAGHTILPPIAANGTSVWKQGRTVPAKFRVCDAMGNSVGTSGVVAAVNLIVMNQAGSSATPSGLFRWDPFKREWVFNIHTSGLEAGDTYVYQVLLNDGTAIMFQFGLTDSDLSRGGG
jgi:hypothetical protein